MDGVSPPSLFFLHLSFFAHPPMLPPIEALTVSQSRSRRLALCEAPLTLFLTLYRSLSEAGDRFPQQMDPNLPHRVRRSSD